MKLYNTFDIVYTYVLQLATVTIRKGWQMPRIAHCKNNHHYFYFLMDVKLMTPLLYLILK